MMFRKGGGRKQKLEFQWKGAEIEKVKTFNYLGYMLEKNNEVDGHTKVVAGRAKAVMGKVWSLGENLLKEQWQQIIRLFDALAKSVIIHGAEIWGWRGVNQFEAILERYIRCTVKLDRRTIGYLVRAETRREKIEVKAGTRALKYEDKLISWRLDTLEG